MITPTLVRIRPDVLIPWRPYVIQRGFREETGVASTLTLMDFATQQKHVVEEPEATVLWDWLLGRVLKVNDAGVLDLCEPQGALREAQVALGGSPEQEGPIWETHRVLAPLLNAEVPVETGGFPRIDFEKVRKQVK